jgi:hypothetical protein
MGSSKSVLLDDNAQEVLDAAASEQGIGLSTCLHEMAQRGAIEPIKTARGAYLGFPFHCYSPPSNRRVSSGARSAGGLREVAS